MEMALKLEKRESAATKRPVDQRWDSTPVKHFLEIYLIQISSTK